MNPSTIRKKHHLDWHPADIKASLAKAGFTFASIARKKGYSPSIRSVLRTPWPTIEAIVGEILDIHPSNIWPSRYDAKGNPLRSRGTVNITKRSARRNG